MGRFALFLGVFLGLICHGEAPQGWNQILSPSHLKVPTGSFPIRAYSEFTPAPTLGVRPYELKSKLDSSDELLKGWELGKLRDPAHPERMLVPLFDELTEIRPGLNHIAKFWLTHLQKLSDGEPAGQGTLAGIPARLLKDNPYWPELEKLPEGPIVSFTALSLARALNEFGQVPWTVYGGSTLGSEAVFWASHPAGKAASWLKQFLAEVYDLTFNGRLRDTEALHAKGVRLLSTLAIPGELEKLRLKKDEAAPDFLITFEPYAKWDKSLKTAYASGAMKVLPSPVTLVFEGSDLYQKIAKQNPEALQFPLAQSFARFAASTPGLRVPGFHVLGDEELGRRWKTRFSLTEEDHPKTSTMRLIFDSSPEVVALYNKPIGRNVQIVGITGPGIGGEFLMNGPVSDRAAIDKVHARIEAAGRRNLSPQRPADEPQSTFHYREYFPYMRVADHSLVWHRPFVAVKDGDKITVHTDLLGVVVATSPTDSTRLVPHLSDRDEISRELAEEFTGTGKGKYNTANNVRKIIELSTLLRHPLSGELASMSIAPDKNNPGEYTAFREKIAEGSKKVAETLDKYVKSDFKSSRVSAKTFPNTVLKGDFEKEYWERLVALTEGTYKHKNNIDCAANEAKDDHCRPEEKGIGGSQLPEIVADYLEPYYKKLGITTYRHAFPWETDYAFNWWGGLKLNDPTKALKDIAAKGHVNLIAVIPGKRHDQSVIMGDHYDTAFMGDIFDGSVNKDLKGHRHASKGADDNHSGTVAVMMAAPALQQLPLERDVWLVHLTGEEFPSDCLGARNLMQWLIEGRQILPGRGNPQVTGLFVLDMVAHNTSRKDENDTRAPSIFQIAPGRGERSAHNAKLAHEVTLTWNDGVKGVDGNPSWNKKRKQAEVVRSKDLNPPPTTLLPEFRGEVRPWWWSSLYNTDEVIFSDTGLPSLLFMEDYDIGRTGYHDTHDTMENIDLDYGAGYSRITIETVAQKALQP